MKNDNQSGSVGQLRTEYGRDRLLETNVPLNPLPLFDQWMVEALSSGQPEPHAMHLSTIDADGMPAGRIVLLRGYDERGLTFYTNYNSDKGQHLKANPMAAATFFGRIVSDKSESLGRWCVWMKLKVMRILIHVRGKVVWAPGPVNRVRNY